MDQDLQYVRFKESRFYGYFQKMVEMKNRLEEQGVYFLFVQVPLEKNIKNLSEFEKERLSDWTFDFNNIREEDYKRICQIYSCESEKDDVIDYLKKVYDGAKVFEMNGIKYLADFKSDLVNVINGKRVTYYQPEKYGNHIYMFGQCTARGTGVEDKDTIASFLQNEVNKAFPDCYRVENMAIGCGSDIHDDMAHAEKIDFRQNDIVIFCTNLEIVPVELFEKNKISYFDCSEIFNRPHEKGEWFTDMTCHTNGIGNEAIADFILEKLCLLNCLNKSTEQTNIPQNMAEPDYTKVPEFVDYIKGLGLKKKAGNNGCIVMNGNPFTFGHLHLIEQSAKKVDNLYVFVVEENKSFFPFDERFQLIKEGTKGISNVEVLPSGKFIISALTFPGYFLKDGNKEIDVDVTSDVLIFAKYIAPALGISVRFVGEEPFDYVTRKYNEEMKQVFPQYHISLEIIPRKETKDGMVISASYVRGLLQKREFELIKGIVPLVTYEYLKRNYDR